MDTLSEDVFEAATSGENVAKLEIQGVDVNALALEFDRLLQLAAERNDYSELLSPVRNFHLYVFILLANLPFPLMDVVV